MSRFLKFLHELGSYGMAGGYAAQLFVLSGSEEVDAASQRLSEELALWIVVPSFVVVVLSGLLAMIVRPVFFRKGWVWLKIFLTAPTLYITIASLGLADLPPERLRASLRLALILIVIITAFSVWRPKNVIIHS